MYNQTWDIKALQSRFARNQRNLESENDQLKNKMKGSSFYEKTYNENIGRLDLNILLETTSNLKDPRLLLNYLNELLAADREPLYGSTSPHDTLNGFRLEIKSIITEIHNSYPHLNAEEQSRNEG